MAEIAQKHKEQLGRIKGNVEKSEQSNRHNVNRYHEFRKFVFDTSITSDDADVLNITQKPVIECNIIEAFISRLRGEFAKQEPSISVRAVDGQPIDVQITQTVESYLRALLFDANNESFEYEIYTDLLSGGFSVMKLWTEYEHENSFNQVIRWGRPYDVTKTGFDQLARLPHKGDGNFCYEWFPKRKTEFEAENPGIDISDLRFTRDPNGGFDWSYTNKEEEILVICDYYEKKKKKNRIVQLSNRQVMSKDKYLELIERWNQAILSGKTLMQPPTVIAERNSEITTICRYRLIDNQVIEYIETDYDHLPLIFVDGNSVLLKDSNDGATRQMTRPYAYHTRGTQRLKNFAMQSLGNELENMVQHKWMMPLETVHPDNTDALTNNQVPNVLIYNGFTTDKQGNLVPLPPPQPVPRVPIPPEIMNTFSMCDQSMQTILGSFDAQLGINNNQLSGVAIVEGATQSNAAAMPFIVGFLKGLNQLAQATVSLIPKYYQTARTMPVRDAKENYSYVSVNSDSANSLQLNYPSNALHVRVEAGVNFAVQKSRALQQIIALSQASPIFAQFMTTTEGLEILLDNLEIRGIDQLKLMAKQFIQQMQQQQKMQQQQPNPQVMKQQLEQQKFAYEQQQDQLNNQLKQAEIANTAQANDNDKLKILLDAQQAGNEMVVQKAKANTEAYAKSVELALQEKDQQHTHAKEAVELAHMVTNTPTQTTTPGVNQNG